MNNIKKIVLFFAILIILLEILSLILIPKNNIEEPEIRNSNVSKIYGEKENTIDVIMYGDSESFASTMPMMWWKDYGYTGYICGTSGQTLPDTCKIAYDTLKKQSPKIIILEADNIYNSLGITVPIAKVLNEILPITEFHNRWKKLTIEDFLLKKEYTKTELQKGYYYVGTTLPADDSKYMEYTDEKEEIPFLNKIYIKSLKKYFESKGAKFYIVSVPSCKNWNYKKHNSLNEFAKKENIEFLDLNEKKDELKINWQEETGDGGDHVNYKGAIKVSKYLGKWLNDKNILEDHRKDENYKKWKEDFDKLLLTEEYYK